MRLAGVTPFQWLLGITGVFPVASPRSSEAEEADLFRMLVATTVGSIAGFVANGLRLAFAELYEPADPLRWPRVLWYGAVALMLGASALARLRTHFALKVDPGKSPITYDRCQFSIDILLIGIASWVLGLIQTSSFPSRTFWVAAAAMSLALILRNGYLNLYKQYPRVIGSGLLWFGSALAVVAYWLGPSIPEVALGIAFYALVGSALQIISETQLHGLR